MQNGVNWVTIKSFVQTRFLSFQYIQTADTYYLCAIDGPIEMAAQIAISDLPSSDQIDFETNFKNVGNKSFTDIDGTLVIRTKAAKKGWTYQLLPIECCTSKFNSLYAKDVAGKDRSGITYKIYDINDVEITDPTNQINATKTVVDYEPAFDYEVIGGHIQQYAIPDTDIRAYVIGVPDVPAIYGGSKEMVGGVNMKFIDPADKVTADGRATKLMSYNAVYHTGKLRFTFKHNPGIQHDLLIVLEHYKG